MKENLIKYKNYIIVGVIIIIIIIVGFLYSEKSTKEIEKEENIEIIKEEQEEINIEEKIKVNIKGEVKNPGVYELNNNSRVIDVIELSGGLTKNANTNYINLSKKVKDEMVIIIYSNKEIDNYLENIENKEVKEIIKYEIIEKEIPCPNTTNNACINTEIIDDSKEEEKENNIEVQNNEEIDNNNETKIININTSSKEELLTLPGIGESKADLIIEYRNTSLFEKVEDIKNVKGIGNSLFEKIKNYITV